MSNNSNETVELRKIATAVERQDEKLDIVIDETMYATAERMQFLKKVLLQAPQVMLADITNENPDMAVTINTGSLYDDVVVESTIYAAPDTYFVVNTTFGKLCDEETTLEQGIAHAGEIWTLIAKKLDTFAAEMVE